MTKMKHTSLFVIILGEVLAFCNLYDIFMLHFVKNIVGVEHKYKSNVNAANMYESLLLEKYPFTCWTPFDEKIAHSNTN
jgi:5-bromo-4-chloroindolyl phosphate hydrolysis protein